MEVTGDDTTVQNPQNLNELQSLLVSFNKEIEDQPSILVHSVIDQQNQQLYVTSSASNITSDSQPIVEGTTKQTFAGFYTEQNILDASSIQDENESQMSVTATASSETQEQGIHVASLMSQRDNSSATSLNDSLQSSEDLPIQAFNPNDLATLNDAEGNVLRIVSIGNDGQMHIINEDQLQQGSEITTDVLTHTIDEKEVTLDGTDPVAVLASVAANTSSVSQIQTVTLNQADANNPQLVAIQNSADSSQPQLVAVQNADGSSTEAVQIIAGSELANINQTLMTNPNNAFQTVTLVPSETGPGGEVSYVLIMGSPDGENIGDGKTLSLDLSGYEFKEEDREVTEELVEEDGKTRRILRITPKTAFVSGVGGQMMCSYCNYTSPKRYLLTRHMKTHSEDRPHKCHFCGRGFKTLASLTNHINTHTGVRPHKCKLCESAFTTSGELVRHVRYKHTFEKPHKCTLCEYASVELSKLKRHMRSHTGERPYQCPHCTYASPDTYKLKRHLRIHTGEKPYECMVCHARFTQSNSLKAHKLIHTGTKPVFQCEFCPTTCGRRTDLKIHVQKLHNSEHPLLCRKCDQTFPDRYTYKIHLKCHEGEKCFKCDTCGHAAISQRHLETHQLIHSGEKPYECDSCDHSFRQKQLLKRHQSLHHSASETGEIAEKEDCHTVTSQYISLVSSSINQSESSTGTETTDLSNELITQNILEKNLMQEWRDGKLGNAQQVVIVHPDGTVEEVTHKLHGFQAAHIQGDDETIELKPDISQIVLQHEEKSEDEASALVISSIDSTAIDETKDAGTQAEFEVEMDENSKNHSIHSKVEPHSLVHSYQASEQSLNQNIQSDNLEEFDHSDEQAADQEDVDNSLHPEVLESVDTETAVFQQEEFIEALDDTDLDSFTRGHTEDPNPLGDDVSSSHYLVHDESQHDLIQDTQPLTDIVDEGAGIQVQTSQATDKKSFPVSPNRQTRSMKRKEDIEAQSPAKRTRRSTMDS